MPTCRSCLPRACHFSMAHVTAPSGVAAGVGVASRAPRVGGRARAYAVASRGSVGARRVSLSPSSRGCDFAGSARDLAASTSRERARGTRVRAVQTRAVQGTSFPPPSSTRGGPSLGGLPNPSSDFSLTRFPTHLVSPSHSGGRDAFPQRDDGGGRSGILRWIARQLTNQAKAIPLLRWPTYGIFNHRTWVALAVDSVIVTVALVALTAIMGGADIMAARVYKLVTGMRT